ncbi:LD-carboxypeptidase [Sporolactobacillus vineae]|uniref:LD-carboxypeptidase n=1 Tax=Sporolactobacillus vineae TaxID=444463 RepID=UPI00028869F8|nr:LD-carboxypeptidase [Sporolactobacillus vineae]
MSSLLNSGDTVGLISCSDGLDESGCTKVNAIVSTLHTLGLRTKLAETIYRCAHSPFSGSPEERAAELMRLFLDPEIRAIFDVSGGDSANQILPYLDFDRIRGSRAFFTGISDLSVLNNALYTRSGKVSRHYRVMNLAGRCAAAQQDFFNKYFMTPESPSFNYRWLRGKALSGTVIGGNIRCFLKLAGTSYFPDPSGKIVFLEALGGGPARMASLLAQLDQLAVFRTCSGVLLGTFSELQEKAMEPGIEQLVLTITQRYGLPVAQTGQLGHGEDARCLPIGRFLHL